MKKQNSDSSVFGLEKVSYYYRNQQALEDISLKISKGERLIILGANGSGKSTLLKMLDGLYFPSKGSIKAFGVKIDADFFQNEENFYDFRTKVGFVFQDPDVQLFSPTVWDEVIFAPLHLGFSNSEVLRRAKTALKLLDIEHLKNRPPYLLSGGEKKRVALATVLAFNPEVWLFDEPTASLDPRSQSRFLDFLDTLSDRGNTVVIATHDLSIVEDMADRVLVLSEEHKMVRLGKPMNILEDIPFLSKHNLVHDHRHKHKKETHKHLHIHVTDHEHKD